MQKKPEDVNVMESLQELQKKKGYLSKPDLKRLAKKKDIPGVDIYGVSTFYSQFSMEKPAKYTISICKGTACHIKNSEPLLQYLEEILKIKAGQKTPDGKIKLEIVNCIGACAKAPAVMVNDEVYGEMTKPKLKELLDSLK